MDRRLFLRFLLLGGAVIGALFGWKRLRFPQANPHRDTDDWERRVYFVCCDNHGQYSVAVYMRVGGGRDAFDTVREAAPFLRADDPGAAAAGLCGFLFKKAGYDGETAGTMSLEPPPEPDPDGTINWREYGSDGDVILINVHTGSAKCCHGSVAGQEIHDLQFGGRKIN
ncbi:MAG TPA: hypothetical protein VFI31_01625 [Pirellulales bacterium]|nr:hypothetical protein [Pirellulales bacterium]